MHTNWTEYYLFSGYIKHENKEIYATDSFRNQKVFVNQNDAPVYAREGSIEYPPRNSNGEIVYIKDKLQRVKYPRNLENQQPIVELDYPLDKDLNPVYEHDSAGQPIFYLKNGLSYYGRNFEGAEVYPKDKNGKEIYRKAVDIEFPALNKDGSPYYAKNEKLDEYYPKRMRVDEEYSGTDVYDIDGGIVLVK